MSFGVYIHWPYCTRICPYCDFNVYRARDRDSSPIIQAIVVDIVRHAARIGKRPADTIFLGGGTPSLLRGADVAELIEAVDHAFGLAPDAEITLEANPDERGRFAEHAAAGVNRFSVGVQALDDAALQRLGRTHDAAAAIAAVDAAHATGARVSLDLIYAREGQGVGEWRDELRRALALPAEHLSLYQLTIEDGTPFARAVARTTLTPPDAERAAALYEATQYECDRAGAPAYEISNHARGDDARSRHNVLYWTGGDWIGVGPGAHGRIPIAGARTATKAHDRPADYVGGVQRAGVGWKSADALTRSEVADETLLMGLRLAEGLDRSRLERLRGSPFCQSVLDDLREQGFLVENAGRLQFTANGRLVADFVVSRLV